MKYTLATAAALFGMALAQAPAGCSSSYSGNFEITLASISGKRGLGEAPELEKRAACGGAGTLVLTLQNGILLDAQGRTGYIAANRQIQFDKPVQAGAVISSGWSVCSDNSLALGNNKVFWQCLSGNFYNLYDQSLGGQCSKITIYAISCGGSSSGGGGASQITDGQVQATSAGRVTQITDGQVQATSAARVTQITDGQIQASRSASSAARVTQITDGQVQASSAARVTQITDGQIQASRSPSSSAARVSQITDGQIQASRTSNVTTPSPTSSRAAIATAQAGIVSVSLGGLVLGLAVAMVGI